jgi:VanZ family protein
MKFWTTKHIHLIGWIASPCIIAFIIIFSLLPSSSISSPLLAFPYSDKVAHAIAYFAGAFTLSLAIVKVEGVQPYRVLLKKNIRRVVSIFVFVVLIGALVELIQPMMNRSCELLDLIADAIGAVGGIFCGLATMHIVQKGELGERDKR